MGLKCGTKKAAGAPAALVRRAYASLRHGLFGLRKEAAEEAGKALEKGVIKHGISMPETRFSVKVGRTFTCFRAFSFWAAACMEKGVGSKTKRIFAVLAALLALACGLAGTGMAGKSILPGLDSPQAEQTWNDFNALLGEVVRDGLVDYAALAGEAARLDAFLALLARARPEEMGANESLAFHVDLYNAATLDLILTRYPDLKSIKDIGSWFESPWGIEFVEYAGRKVSLDYIEHEVLRRRFADPRIHFALNCSAVSCPPLRAELYAPDRVDEQLDDAARTFINDPEAVFVRGGELYLSRIFRWYAEDFAQGAESFVRGFAGPELLRSMEPATNNGKLRVRYLPYDWSLNDVGRAGGQAGSGTRGAQ